MRTRHVGAVEVSVVGLGCNQIGTTCDLETARGIVGAALDNGITLFDTADEYGGGASEEMLGTLLRGERDRIVLSTKFGCTINGDPACSGASARWIERACEDSLRRLRTDRIDLYQLHFPDPAIPIEETLEALSRLVAAGKVREVGACNLSPAQIDAAAAASPTPDAVRFRSLQVRYNLLRQEAAEAQLPACERADWMLIPYFPLAAGLLTGKYRRGAPPVPGSRLAENVPADVAERVLSDQAFDQIEAFEAFAAREGRKLNELAVGWLAAQPIVASVICGATNPQQVAANVAGASWMPDDALMAEMRRVGRDRA